MDMPTTDLIKGDAHKAVSILTCPRRKPDAIEAGKVCGMADVRRTTHHEHAPSLVVEDVRTVDLKGRHGIICGRIEFAAAARSKHDGVLVHGEIDRVDERTAAHSDGDPTYSMSLKSQYALVSTEWLNVNAFKVVRDTVHFVKAYRPSGVQYAGLSRVTPKRPMLLNFQARCMINVPKD